MSNRAEEKAYEIYPLKGLYPLDECATPDLDINESTRSGFICGYEQAEKDTIERAMEWIKTHWREYIIGPDADGCICFGHWENDFRKAMEEDNG